MTKSTHGAEYERDWDYDCSKCGTRKRKQDLLFPFAKRPDGTMEALPPFCLDKRWCEMMQKRKKAKK